MRISNSSVLRMRGKAKSLLISGTSRYLNDGISNNALEKLDAFITIGHTFNVFRYVPGEMIYNKYCALRKQCLKPDVKYAEYITSVYRTIDDWLSPEAKRIVQSGIPQREPPVSEDCKEAITELAKEIVSHFTSYINFGDSDAQGEEELDHIENAFEVGHCLGVFLSDMGGKALIECSMDLRNKFLDDSLGLFNVFNKFEIAIFKEMVPEAKAIFDKDTYIEEDEC